MVMDKTEAKRRRLLDQTNEAAFVGFLYASSVADTLFDLCKTKGIEVPELVLEWREQYKAASEDIKDAGAKIRRLKAGPRKATPGEKSGPE